MIWYGKEGLADYIICVTPGTLSMGDPFQFPYTYTLQV